MVNHQSSDEDQAFRLAFEAGHVAPAQFDHRAHVRLAYVYLVSHDADAATGLFRGALQRFLQHHGIAPEKYHETLTRAWTLAVRHFMARSPAMTSADAFIAHNPELLDTRSCSRTTRRRSCSLPRRVRPSWSRTRVRFRGTRGRARTEVVDWRAEAHEAGARCGRGRGPVVLGGVPRVSLVLARVGHPDRSGDRDRVQHRVRRLALVPSRARFR